MPRSPHAICRSGSRPERHAGKSYVSGQGQAWTTCCSVLAFMLGTAASFAETASLPPVQAPMPPVAFSAIRVFGSLILVLALFLGGVWLFRNWQRLTIARGGRTPQLNILEVKSIGNRQALLLVACGSQRLLLGSSPAGLHVLTQLPQADCREAKATELADFSETLNRVLASGS